MIKLSGFTYTGALAIYTLSGRTLCTGCAQGVLDEGIISPRSIKAWPHLDGPPATCHECGAKMVSAYGERGLTLKHELGAAHYLRRA